MWAPFRICFTFGHAVWTHRRFISEGGDWYNSQTVWGCVVLSISWCASHTCKSDQEWKRAKKTPKLSQDVPSRSLKRFAEHEITKAKNKATAQVSWQDTYFGRPGMAGSVGCKLQLGIWTRYDTILLWPWLENVGEGWSDRSDITRRQTSRRPNSA